MKSVGGNNLPQTPPRGGAQGLQEEEVAAATPRTAEIERVKLDIAQKMPLSGIGNRKSAIMSAKLLQTSLSKGS